MQKVDDTLGVIHTHGVVALAGGIGIGVGILPDPKVIEFLGTGKDRNVSITGVLFGNPHQFILQLYAAGFIILLNMIGTFILLKLIGLSVPLRMDEENAGDR